MLTWLLGIGVPRIMFQAAGYALSKNFGALIGFFQWFTNCPMLFRISFTLGIQWAHPAKAPLSPLLGPLPDASAPDSDLPKTAGEAGAQDDDRGTDEPVILHVATMSRSEMSKVKRIVQPKPYSGKLEVPKDIMNMWNTPKGKEQLFQMWAKSGGVKAGN